MLLKAGLGVAGLFIIVFSCVTTNFIDAFSCNQSTYALFPKDKIPQESEGKSSLINNIKVNLPGIIDTIIGTAGAILFPMENITEFLYFIGSVFAPMISVQIADQFIIKHRKTDVKVDAVASIAWIIGFVMYRILMKYDFIVGYTIPNMVITILITIALRKLAEKIPSLSKKPA